MFDLERMSKECKIAVSSAKLTVKDLRTGEKQEVMFYRPGNVFPLEAVQKELAEYGFQVDLWALPDPNKAVIDWQLVYNSINRLDLSAATIEERCIKERA